VWGGGVYGKQEKKGRKEGKVGKNMHYFAIEKVQRGSFTPPPHFPPVLAPIFCKLSLFVPDPKDKEKTSIT